ncbi:hypothetical protein MARA_29170 [Mycolicibacterium arabiense]|uniref:Uncharacterized protein n=1 Tax=Mycolicibacterium arabiense TaxID=1286181 RepID=A0A7I7RZS9_9MYCO|nr:hypothetical protein MARA_29170 [Mycolicibacterium arabiense]
MNPITSISRNTAANPLPESEFPLAMEKRYEGAPTTWRGATLVLEVTLRERPRASFW